MRRVYDSFQKEQLSATLREAADKDYQLTVLSDGCVDNDEEVQRVLLSKVFPRQADVVQASAWSARLKAEAGIP
jgi:nicotinamidase-related amidase